MLEKNHLKSQFYLEHTFYSSPIQNEFSFKNLQDHNFQVKIPGSKSTQNKSITPSTCKNILNLIEDHNTLGLNQSLIVSSKTPEHLILATPKRPKIWNFSETKSAQGIKIKTPKVAENLISEQSSSRFPTPYFKKRANNGVGEIKKLCDKLVFDQKIMKKVIIKQQENLAKHDLLSPKAHLNNFPKIFRFDSVNTSKRLNFQEPFNKSSASPIDSYQISRFNSPSALFLEPDTLVPKFSLKIKKSAQISPKYYRDKPRIKSVLGFPNKVFTPKNCN